VLDVPLAAALVSDEVVVVVVVVAAASVFGLLSLELEGVASDVALALPLLL